MKALVGAFNQEKALVGAFSVIVQPVVEPMDRFTALFQVQHGLRERPPQLHQVSREGNEPMYLHIDIFIHTYTYIQNIFFRVM